jgi:hypothetical protein
VFFLFRNGRASIFDGAELSSSTFTDFQRAGFFLPHQCPSTVTFIITTFSFLPLARPPGFASRQQHGFGPAPSAGFLRSRC